MKPLLPLILFFLFAISFQTVAQSVSSDSLVIRLQQRASLRSSFELGNLDIQAYTFGSSQCQKQGLVGRLIPHLLPFEGNPSRDVAFEAFSHAHYQWPGDMHINITALQANQPRKAKRVIRQLYRALLPIYAIRRYKDYGSNKSFVLPFYDEGPERYEFKFAPIPDTLLIAARQIGLLSDTSRLCCISFEPRRQHHTMLHGCVLVDSVSTNVLGIDCNGRIDMATFRTQLFFSPDSLHGGLFIPHSSHIDIDYRYLGTRSRNSYLTRFRYLTYTPFDSLDLDLIPNDLTPYYQDEDVIEATDFELLRPFDLPLRIDSLLYRNSGSTISTSSHRKKRRIETFSETLVGGSSMETENSRLRIYGPLDPALLGYDQFNGVTISEQARWTHRFHDKSELYMRAELGYAFKLQEMRFRFINEWTYLPRRRGQIRLEARRSNSNFSSKFINTVNEILKNQPGAFSFETTGLEYYQSYNFSLEHSIELSNGLMLHAGIVDTYRRPVTRNSNYFANPVIGGRTSDQPPLNIDEVTSSDEGPFRNHFSDFAPFVRLVWTPHQYYWYDDGYKTYIHSPAPTFTLEFSRSIPGVLNANSNYGRIEFDMHQQFGISRTNSFAYHFGMGKFFNQRGEYFISYRYFSRSIYPSSWEDDRIGGKFHLLDEYWYASSPSYVQAHLMYDTPFGLLHLIRFISRYVIKERIYWGALYSEGKNFYNEVGYGIDNNYFNVGVFAGFKGFKYNGVGVKFRIEIGRHI